MHKMPNQHVRVLTVPTQEGHAVLADNCDLADNLHNLQDRRGHNLMYHMADYFLLLASAMQNSNILSNTIYTSSTIICLFSTSKKTSMYRHTVTQNTYNFNKAFLHWKLNAF